MRTRRRSFAFHAEGDEPVGCSTFLCLDQHLAPDEFWFFQIDEKPQAGFDRIVFRREIGAVQRIAHLQAERVARAETAGPNAQSAFPFSRTSFQILGASLAGKKTSTPSSPV